ncbi:nucleoside triphosphate hydrolase [Pseudorhodobacter wandonensis]|jgi:fructokinase|uniref:nucleoside triphosphate hydrolase n=1 Tax=Pseudorhodobacter wandonensis TaxID=1120568 RepID=UPI00067DE736|nr:nucleoside triphosphate hydrolase [Pseudorhodobacter wandonensis]
MKAALDAIAAASRATDGRVLIAIAGPPGAGKSTLAEALADRIAGAAVVPMDGFHLDNTVLEQRGLLARKGAPESFDAAGFLNMVTRLKRGEEVVIPVFDRARDIAIAGARVIGPEQRVLLIEGNYLLLDRAPWNRLAGCWDLTIGIEVPLPVLEARLVQRWRDHGLMQAAAVARAMGNDIPNAQQVVAGSVSADVVIRQG